MGQTELPTSVTPREPRAADPLPGLRPMNEVEPVAVNWVWYPYIPAGKLTMLEGDPGLGKSWISCDIASRLSTGTPFPGEDQPRAPARAMLLSAEDGLEDTLQPRLVALRANLHNVVASDRPFTLTERSLRSMEEEISKAQAVIAFIDPIVGYMGGKIDMNKANEVREIMAALAQVAKRTGAAIIGVRHLRKMGGTNAKYRGLGSIDFTAAARSALQVGETKHGNTFMEHIKHNLSPAGPTLGYRINGGQFEWTGEVNTGPADKPATVTTSRSLAKLFLERVLARGGLPVDDVLVLAAEQGIGESTLQKAKAGLVKSIKRGPIWEWNLIAPSELIPAEAPVTSATPRKVDPAALEAALALIGQGKPGA